MKRLNWLLVMVVWALGLGLSACDDSYPPPGGWGSSLDDNLVGSWQLIYVNGVPVSGTAANYFDFYGSGRGTYYYYQGGVAYSEPVTWWNEYDSSGNWLCIQYTGSYSEVRYWFNSDATRLYMQWYEAGRMQQYVYAYTGSVNWYGKPALSPSESSWKAPGGERE